MLTIWRVIRVIIRGLSGLLPYDVTDWWAMRHVAPEGDFRRRSARARSVALGASMRAAGRLAWRALSANNPPCPRSSHALSAHGSRIYVFGGECGPASSHFGHGMPVRLPAVHCLDVRAPASWETLPSCQQPALHPPPDSGIVRPFMRIDQAARRTCTYLVVDSRRMRAWRTMEPKKSPA